MIIDLSRLRSEYFAFPSAGEVLTDTLGASPSVSSLKDFPSRVATKSGSLEELLQREHIVDSGAALRAIDEASTGLIILPPEYRIGEDAVRDLVVYDLDSMLRLDSMAVQRRLLGDDATGHRLSKKRKQQYAWSPEKVMSAAFSILGEEGDIEAIHSTIGWFGRDQHRRILSLYRSVQGAELRAFQNMVAYKLLIPTFRKALRTGKYGDRVLDDALKNDLAMKVLKYERYVTRHNLKSSLSRLDVDFTDLIDVSEIPFASGTKVVQVPSQRKTLNDSYQFKLTGIPFVEGNKITEAYSEVWEARGKCYCKDKTYRSDRRVSAHDEDFFCAHEISAYHTLRRKNEGEDVHVPLLPFLIPTKEMIGFVDKLRYQTIMLTYRPQTQRWSKRTLNHTEMENLMFKKVMRDGYEACFTTSIDRFREEKYNPDLDLVRFRN
ncbi:hypothetical protein H6504_04725 [Candidatus Woesearchaeota archaeon]|nr:hypothetical protein [Candidatus Woesearchaeota archaeon]